ncbi:hypothetical protein ACP70R_045700 [Stipagrostis hirtigluma subsp. patula]
MALDPQSSLLLWNKAEHYLFSSSLTDQNQVPSELATEDLMQQSSIRQAQEVEKILQMRKKEAGLCVKTGAHL